MLNVNFVFFRERHENRLLAQRDDADRDWPLSGRARLADLSTTVFMYSPWPNERTTRRQHAANMLSPGQGSPDPVRAYHAHWAKCAVGEAAPAFILAGEANRNGVTVLWGVHWGGHPPA